MSNDPYCSFVTSENILITIRVRRGVTTINVENINKEKAFEVKINKERLNEFNQDSLPNMKLTDDELYTIIFYIQNQFQIGIGKPF